MYTDLFLALLNRKNARAHPILSALAYLFCPMTAYWWLAGADPVPPFDPVWQCLLDLTSGGTLREHLTRYGFEGQLEEVRQYIERVRLYRSQHPAILAPELSPFFSMPRIELTNRFGSQNAIHSLGGDWRNLFTYVRAWAYLVQDWRAGLNVDSESGYLLKNEKVSLILPFTRLPVQFDAWVWKVPVGHVVETKIGLLVSNLEQDQISFSLMAKCSPSGDHPWPNTPAIFSLDRENGQAQAFDQTLPGRELERVVQHLSDLARHGPHHPLHALRQPSICRKCGYQNQCFKRDLISPFALKDL
ncbi:MAG: hypothetical protein IPJ46_09530 [Anaerolineales bacterium]|nr:hypothetical protein [Anaerolineales bacterium]